MYPSVNTFKSLMCILYTYQLYLLLFEPDLFWSFINIEKILHFKVFFFLFIYYNLNFIKWILRSNKIHYIFFQVISIAADDVDVTFMKKTQNGLFIWPEIPDKSIVDRKRIIKKLNHPKEIRKRRSIEMFFQDTWYWSLQWH